MLTILNINWQSFLFGSEDWTFLPVVLLRSTVMFLVILFGLRLLGKRSVSQLSVFELGVIIALGSAAGDPMFIEDAGLVICILVFAIVITLYRLMTFMINKSDRIEKALEGEPVYLVKDGKIDIKNFEKESIAHNELFSQLRLSNISHLGQIDTAIIETNGLISLFYFEDEDVKWGLPILPHLCEKKLLELVKAGTYACRYCGDTFEAKAPAIQQTCTTCGRKEWIAASNTKRIA